MRQRGGDHEHPVARQEGGQAVPGGARRAEGNPLQDDHPLLPLIGGLPPTRRSHYERSYCDVTALYGRGKCLPGKYAPSIVENNLHEAFFTFKLFFTAIKFENIFFYKINSYIEKVN